MTPLAPLITNFLRSHLPVEKGCSPHTCETYAYAYRLFFEFASERLATQPSRLILEQLDATMVVAFLEHLEVERKNAVTTRNARLAAIKAFMRYVEHRVPSALGQVRQIHAIPTKRHDDVLVGHLTMDEVQAVLDAPSPKTRMGIRDRAMLHLCFAAGLRVSELVGLPQANLEFQPTPSVHIVGKGRRERRLPLWKETAKDLRAWLSVRGEVLAPELFVNARGNAMSRAGFEYILAKHVATAARTCRSLDERAVSPHQLRHSCAVLMLQATGDIRKVALWLGHADVRTTEIYLRVDPAEKLAAVEAMLPPQLRRGTFRAPDALIASLMPRGNAERSNARR
jgi:integrase/recombinase XerD